MNTDYIYRWLGNSKFDPPKKVTDDVDTVNINFYRKWAIKHGYLKLSDL